MTKKLLSTLTLCSLLAGCSTMKHDEMGEIVLNKEETQEALSHAKPPQQFGYNLYPVGKNVALAGKPRLHPRHMATANFASEEYPVIKVYGSAKRASMMALLDTAMLESWLEFDHAMEFGTVFLGLDGRNIPYRGNVYLGQAEAYAAAVPQIRIDQFFIEDTPVFVRMAAYSLGPLSRGIKDPEIDAVLGYDLLRNMEYIHFNMAEGYAEFSATIPYTPNESNLIGAAPIVAVRGIGLAVQGMVDGVETPVILDLAGNYHLARNDATITTTRMVGLGEVICVNTPTIVGITPDGLPRAGMRLLERYVITVCPRIGVVYFERPNL